MLSLDLIREHCRVDAEDVSDSLLTSYHKAAIRLFENRTGRVLLFDEAENNRLNAIAVSEDIQAALLMLTDHFVNHKGIVSSPPVMSIPMGARHIMDLHRWFYE